MHAEPLGLRGAQVGNLWDRAHKLIGLLAAYRFSVAAASAAFVAKLSAVA